MPFVNAKKGRSMKDSRGPDAAPPEASPLSRPCRHNLRLPPASESLQHHRPATPPAQNPPPTRRSWSERAGLLLVVVAGAVGLVRLADHVTTPRSEGNGGIIVRNELIRLWFYPGLLELAPCPKDFAACRTLEGYRRYAEERGPEKAWYVITSRGYQVNRETVVLTTIRRPYKLTEPFYPEFLGVLAIAAGKPPHNPLTDFSKVKSGVIPRRSLDADPRAVLDELRMLEDQPAQGTTR
jgi:hypothetical protein